MRARYRAITVAVRQAVTTAGYCCEIGDVDCWTGDIVEIGATYDETGKAIVRRMLEAAVGTDDRHRQKGPVRTCWSQIMAEG